MIAKLREKNNKIILLGAGGHAKSVIDSIERANKFQIEGLISNDVGESKLESYSIIGCDDDLERIYQAGIKYAFITVGYLGEGQTRAVLYKKLRQIGYKIPSIIDPTAIIANSAQIGEGSFIAKKAVVNSNASIGNMCIINTAAIVEHDCCVEDYAHISVSAVLCGNVKIGRNTFVGANSTIIQGHKIGEKCIIGAGAIVTKDIENGSTIYNRINNSELG